MQLFFTRFPYLEVAFEQSKVLDSINGRDTRVGHRRHEALSHLDVMLIRCFQTVSQAQN